MKSATSEIEKFYVVIELVTDSSMRSFVAELSYKRHLNAVCKESLSSLSSIFDTCPKKISSIVIMACGSRLLLNCGGH